jgi:hypothetical protein
MQLSYGIGKIEDHLRHERAGLHVAPSLQLEQVSLRPDDDAPVEALANPSHGVDPSRRQGALATKLQIAADREEDERYSKAWR